MARVKTVYCNGLRKPDSYTVRCGNESTNIKAGEEEKVGRWIDKIWEGQLCKKPAYVYYNIGWDNDDVLYCKYELI